MPLHLAQSPTHAFVNHLVATADVDTVEVGDTVEVHGDNLEVDDAKVLEVLADNEGVRIEWTDENGARQEAVTGEDDYATTTFSPTLAAAYERELQHGVPDGVAWADDLVPAALTGELNASFDAIIATGTATYHPRSSDIVLDLVHPSLYPYVKGKSELVSAPPTSEAPRFDRFGRPYEGSAFQWLPSELEVAADGTTQLTSYVNNLEREETVGELERLFSVALPLFDSVYGYVSSQKFLSEGWEDETYNGEADLPEPASEVQQQAAPAPVSLRGKKLQVVPKLVEYQINDGQVHSGVWHVEGMSHEHVIATAVYVLDRSDNFEGGELRFKRPYTLEEAGQLFWNVSQIRKRHTDDIVAEGLVPIGSLATPKGRLFVFPNCHAHKISDMTTSGGRATRRIVVFWLVDPERPIVSTAHVPPQQEKISADEAKQIQLALMEERRLHKQTFNVRAVQLCEH